MLPFTALELSLAAVHVTSGCTYLRSSGPQGLSRSRKVWTLAKGLSGGLLQALTAICTVVDSQGLVCVLAYYHFILNLSHFVH